MSDTTYKASTLTFGENYSIDTNESLEFKITMSSLNVSTFSSTVYSDVTYRFDSAPFRKVKKFIFQLPGGGISFAADSDYNSMYCKCNVDYITGIIEKLEDAFKLAFNEKNDKGELKKGKDVYDIKDLKWMSPIYEYVDKETEEKTGKKSVSFSCAKVDANDMKLLKYSILYKDFEDQIKNCYLSDNELNDYVFNKYLKIMKKDKSASALIKDVYGKDVKTFADIPADKRFEIWTDSAALAEHLKSVQIDSVCINISNGMILPKKDQYKFNLYFVCATGVQREPESSDDLANEMLATMTVKDDDEDYV